MKILHTADWHIGRTLYGKKRYEEFRGFLDWLIETIDAKKIEVLLVAGDIFDTTAPSHRAQELYYNFLCRVANSPCRHVVVTAGNHDSPSFLDAPKELLKALHVHVVGSVPDALEKELCVLRDPQNVPELIVCAVPYLRDRDIRTAEAGESLEDKESKLVEGIRNHYAQVAALAEAQRRAIGRPIPIVGMGHLFTAGGQTIEGDGVRNLYIGSLAHVGADLFPSCFDYVALGHLHVPQKVGSSETIRYSGSPLPMGFGEAGQTKSVVIVEFPFPSESNTPSETAKGNRQSSPRITLENVPVFQKLERLCGDIPALSQKISDLAPTASGAWLELVYEGPPGIANLRESLDEAAAQEGMEILRIKDSGTIERALEPSCENETLDNLDETEVFMRYLTAHDVAENLRPELLRTYQEALQLLNEQDARAE
jgi:exonuclease SbcD